jgi:hypothetical protein
MSALLLNAFNIGSKEYSAICGDSSVLVYIILFIFYPFLTILKYLFEFYVDE